MSGVRLDGRVVLVTGAAGGLGRAYAAALAGHGATLVLNDIGVDPLGRPEQRSSAEDVAASVRSHGGRAVADASSVAGAQGGRAVVERALKEFGRLDAVVHSAGVGAPDGEFDELEDDALAAVLDSHLGGAFHVLRPAWAVMREQGYGRIVTVSSGVVLGAPFAHSYAAAKAGIIGLTRALAASGEPLGIKVNCLMPLAWTRLAAANPDPRTRDWMREHMPAEKVAPAVVALVSDDVPCNGELISVGGGRLGRVAFAVAPAARPEPFTAEAVREHLALPLEAERMQVARSVEDDVRRLRADEPPIPRSVVFAWFAAMESGDGAAAAALLAEDCEIWLPGDLPGSGTLSKAAFLELVGQLGEQFSEPIRLSFGAVTAQEDRVAVEAAGESGLRNGRSYRNRYHMLFRVRDGRIVLYKEYSDTLHIKQAFGLPDTVVTG